jgi:hypothetical protein
MGLRHRQGRGARAEADGVFGGGRGLMSVGHKALLPACVSVAKPLPAPALWARREIVNNRA